MSSRTLSKSKSQFHLLTKSFFPNFPRIQFASRLVKGRQKYNYKVNDSGGNMKNFLIFSRVYIKKSFSSDRNLFTTRFFRLRIFTSFHHAIIIVFAVKKKMCVMWQSHLIVDMPSLLYSSEWSCFSSNLSDEIKFSILFCCTTADASFFILCFTFLCSVWKVEKIV